MTKQIHVNVGYGALSDKDVATQGVAVVDGMTNNAKSWRRCSTRPGGPRADGPTLFGQLNGRLKKPGAI